jgi:hypothetical protein
VPRYVHAHGCSAEHPNVSRRSAHPSTGVSEAKGQSPDAAMRARERVGLFDMVKNAPAGDRPRSGRPRARKRGPMITGRWSWVPALAALRRDYTGLVATPTCGCRKASPARLLCFAPVLYREPCNSNVSSPERGPFWPNERNVSLTWVASAKAPFSQNDRRRAHRTRSANRRIVEGSA